MMVIAVDTGNRYIKTAHAEPFSAGLVYHYDSPPVVATDTLCFDEQYYTFSETQGFHRKDKTADDYYFILTLAAVAREIVVKRAMRESQGDTSVQFAKVMRDASREKKVFKEDVCLSVGLPPRDMKGMADKFKRYFLRDGKPLTFTYNDIRFEVTILDVLVSAQGFAAVFPNDLFRQVTRSPQAYIIDIGGYTTDIALIANRKVDLTFFESLEFGVIHLYNEVSTSIQNDFGVEINGVLIEAILRGESIGQPKIEDAVRRATAAYAKRLILALKDRRIDLDLSLPVLVGGGAQLMQTALKNAIGRADVFVIPDVRANAIGYESFAYRVLKERQAQKK